jgi:hypothetical protein
MDTSDGRRPGCPEHAIDQDQIVGEQGWDGGEHPRRQLVEILGLGECAIRIAAGFQAADQGDGPADQGQASQGLPGFLVPEQPGFASLEGPGERSR